MQPKMYFMLLMAVVVSASRSATLATNHKIKSIQQNEPQINLYEQFFEYLKAFLSHGIPDAEIPPLDPYYKNETIEIQVDNPTPHILNITIQINGLTISDYSNFQVALADLSLEEMYANLELYDDYIGLQAHDIVASGLDKNGRLLQYNCSTIYGSVNNNEYTSNKALELNGDYLQVKHIFMDYHAGSIGVSEQTEFCQGDNELSSCMFDQILDYLSFRIFENIPTVVTLVSDSATGLLDYIFELRNVTRDVDGETETSNHAKANHDIANELILPQSNIGRETRMRLVERSSYKKSANKSQSTRFTIKSDNSIF